jgi:hypothetical protein
MTGLLDGFRNKTGRSWPTWWQRVRAARPPRREAMSGRSEPRPLAGAPDSTLELQRIEACAERTLVQEIRLFERQVSRMLPQLRGEDLAYAWALLLKLDHLASQQQTRPAAEVRPSRYLP